MDSLNQMLFVVSEFLAVCLLKSDQSSFKFELLSRKHLAYSYGQLVISVKHKCLCFVAGLLGWRTLSPNTSL